mmetsp:Transcript_30998/g.92212  ORF Transcript_30998/g.92212 Transcript_30998/m.92212 type:complete len:205 (-) Transcript_30998:498-1112(-)
MRERLRAPHFDGAVAAARDIAVGTLVRRNLHHALDDLLVHLGFLQRRALRRLKCHMIVQLSDARDARALQQHVGAELVPVDCLVCIGVNARKQLRESLSIVAVLRLQGAKEGINKLLHVEAAAAVRVRVQEGLVHLLQHLLVDLVLGLVGSTRPAARHSWQCQLPRQVSCAGLADIWCGFQAHGHGCARHYASAQAGVSVAVLH